MALDVLDVTITRVVFHKPSKWSPAGAKFLIAKTSTGATIKGEIANAREGERMRLWGEWRPSKGYDEPAFEFVSHEVLFDDGIGGVVDYLRHYVPGLGLVKASAIVAMFESDTLRVLRTNPDEALGVVGITPAIVESIRQHFETDGETVDPAAYAKLVDMFSGHRFPCKTVLALLKNWGSDAPAKIAENPYMLIAYPRMGWQGVDAFALDPNGLAYEPVGIERQVAAIIESMNRLAADGHTFGSRFEVDQIAFRLLGAKPEDVAWTIAVIDQNIVRLADSDDWILGEYLSDTDETFALPKYAEAEQSIARHIRRLAGGARGLDFRLDSPRLNDEQRAAMATLEGNGVAILAGAPGVGKSWTLAEVIGCLKENGFRKIKLVAPTGKAAKRSQELLDAAVPGHGVQCSTIHKALGIGKSDDEEGVPTADAKINRGREAFGFKHCERNPLDVNMLVCEESSMLDVRLAAALLASLATGTRLVFVGDPNQLPSVGPGSVLRDMIAAGVPTATLNTIQRSDGGGRVVRACHAIKDGMIPAPAERVDLPTENWVHVELDDPAAIAATIVGLHESVKRNGKYDPLWDVQVVSAQKGRLPIGCDNLNTLLGRSLNPQAWAADAGEEFGPPFRVGDKVVRTKNALVDELIPLHLEEDAHEDWRWGGQAMTFREVAVVNGDMGQVLDIVMEDRAAYAVVQFRTPDRLCRLPMGEPHIIPAYAMTVHKCQGSGMPYVIVPVHHSYYWDSRTNIGLWSRELVYTAISRAEKLLVTVGQFSAIRAAIGRKTVGHRRTRLEGLVRDAAGVERVAQ